VQVQEFIALRGGLQDRGFVQFLSAHCGDTRCWLRGRVGDFSLGLAPKEGPSWSVFSVACGRGPERTRTADLRFRNWNLALCAVLQNYRDFVALCVRRSNALPDHRPLKSAVACACETARSLISRTASSLNSRVNLCLSTTHLRFHKST